MTTAKLTQKQREVLARIVEAERGTVGFRRDIGRLQSAAVVIDGEEIPRSANSFSALLQAGLVLIHKDDTGIAPPPVQRVFSSAAGREVEE